MAVNDEDEGLCAAAAFPDEPGDPKANGACMNPIDPRSQDLCTRHYEREQQ